MCKPRHPRPVTRAALLFVYTWTTTAFRPESAADPFTAILRLPNVRKSQSERFVVLCGGRGDGPAPTIAWSAELCGQRGPHRDELTNATRWHPSTYCLGAFSWWQSEGLRRAVGLSPCQRPRMSTERHLVNAVWRSNARGTQAFHLVALFSFVPTHSSVA
jgi:hypothetical protein